MEFTNKDIEDFIAAWQADVGERLTPEEARIQATQLHSLYAAMTETIAAHPEHFAKFITDEPL